MHFLSGKKTLQLCKLHSPKCNTLLILWVTLIILLLFNILYLIFHHGFWFLNLMRSDNAYFSKAAQVINTGFMCRCRGKEGQGCAERRKWGGAVWRSRAGVGRGMCGENAKRCTDSGKCKEILQHQNIWRNSID